MSNVLIENIEKVHTTEMGVDRIRKNLGLGDIDVVAWCQTKIRDKEAVITRQGKNWYVRIDGCEITVNASSYTIITAHKNKRNPWEGISLNDYENHMSLDSVNQLQTLNSIMKRQFETYPVESVIILGIAGGNGLEHIRKEKYRKVYGIDINVEYLHAVSERYLTLSGILQCIQLDLLKDVKRLPKAQFIIANLLIEYTGYSAFRKVVRQIEPEYVSCVIQINTDEDNWVSDSPYIHSFDGLDDIHHQMEEKDIAKTMNEEGYRLILRESWDLPNGKALVRLDFENRESTSMGGNAVISYQRLTENELDTFGRSSVYGFWIREER